MVRIEADKSARWYSQHCGFCDKTFGKLENRVKVTAELMSGRMIKALACEPCARSATIAQAAEQMTKEMTKG
jgi:hypothetical protein